MLIPDPLRGLSFAERCPPACRAEYRRTSCLLFVAMPHIRTDRRDLGEPVGHLLSLGLTQLSIQVTLSTSLTSRTFNSYRLYHALSDRLVRDA
jgi:hypothetical protein